MTTQPTNQAVQSLSLEDQQAVTTLTDLILREIEEDPLRAFKLYLAKMAALLDSTVYFGVVASRPGIQPEHPIMGWRVVDVVHRPDATGFQLDMIGDYEVTDQYMHGDIPIQKLTRGDKPRAMAVSHEFAGKQGAGYFSIQLLQALQMGDRVMAAMPVNTTSGLFFSFDRAINKPTYGPREVELVRSSLTSLSALGVAVAKSYRVF